MPESRWRVAIIDSGLGPHSAIEPFAACRFVDSGDAVVACEPVADFTGHGTAVAEIVVSCSQSSKGCSPPELLIAQAMDEHGRSTPAAVAAAVQWALKSNAQLIHLSLGLAHDRPILAAAIAGAVELGVVVVAATPARGAVSFPAAYRNVLRGSGDARCRVDEISHLEPGASFGSCAQFTTLSGRCLRGASIGAAHLTRFICARLSPAENGVGVAERLSGLVAYRGRENRSAGSGQVSAGRRNS